MRKSHYITLCFVVFVSAILLSCGNREMRNLEKNATDGDVAAIRKIAEKYYDGEDVHKNYTKALEWYLKLEDEATPMELYRISVCYKICPHRPKHSPLYEIIPLHITYLEKSARAGYAEAQYNLGKIYYYGMKPFIRDTIGAAYWYTEAANQGYADALYALGCINHLDREKADSLYHLAYVQYLKEANRGDAESMLMVGKCYLLGHGLDSLENHEEEANLWFKKAIEQFQKLAENGNAEAMYNLATCYSSGYGVDENEDTAQIWIEAAESQILEDIHGKGDEKQECEVLEILGAIFSLVLMGFWPIVAIIYMGKFLFKKISVWISDNAEYIISEIVVPLIFLVVGITIIVGILWLLGAILSSSGITPVDPDMYYKR